MSKALFLGYCKVTNNAVVPIRSSITGSRRPRCTIRAGKKLMAEAGHAGGFDAGPHVLRQLVFQHGRGLGQQPGRDRHPGEIAADRARRVLRRLCAKKYKRGIIQAASGAFGNAATRMDAFVVKGGAFAYGSYPDIDELFPKQAEELDPGKRKALLDKMQQLVQEKAIFAPIWQLGFLNGVGPTGRRVRVRPHPGLCLHGAVRRHDDQRQGISVARHGAEFQEMKQYIIRRVGYCLLSLFLLSLTIFFFVRVTGDPGHPAGRTRRKCSGHRRHSQAVRSRSAADRAVLAVPDQPVAW
jgi:hypothetical protein